MLCRSMSWEGRLTLHRGTRKCMWCHKPAWTPKTKTPAVQTTWRSRAIGDEDAAFHALHLASSSGGQHKQPKTTKRRSPTTPPGTATAMVTLALALSLSIAGMVAASGSATAFTQVIFSRTHSSLQGTFWGMDLGLGIYQNISNTTNTANSSQGLSVHVEPAAIYVRRGSNAPRSHLLDRVDALRRAFGKRFRFAQLDLERLGLGGHVYQYNNASSARGNGTSADVDTQLEAPGAAFVGSHWQNGSVLVLQHSSGPFLLNGRDVASELNAMLQYGLDIGELHPADIDALVVPSSLNYSVAVEIGHGGSENTQSSELLADADQPKIVQANVRVPAISGKTAGVELVAVEILLSTGLSLFGALDICSDWLGPVPTPTLAPTQVPTMLPTLPPSYGPYSPTIAPTTRPTSSPTPLPTTSPTAVPTGFPTSPPTSLVQVFENPTSSNGIRAQDSSAGVLNFCQRHGFSCVVSWRRHLSCCGFTKCNGFDENLKCTSTVGTLGTALRVVCGDCPLPCPPTRVCFVGGGGVGCPLAQEDECVQK